jgi:ADP-ribose pyrophosphatase
MTEHIQEEYQLSTRLVGESELTVVNKHLRYRTDSVEFPNGYRGEYTYIDDEHPAVGIAALDKRMGQRSLFMIFQERYPSQTAGWEIPAGGSNGDELAAAKNELEEEGGLKARVWHQLPRQVENTGRGNSRLDLFVAADIEETEARPEKSEVILDQGWFTFGQAEELMLDGQISAGHTLASIALISAFINKNPDHPIVRMTQ